MINLTRGIKLYLDIGSAELVAGPGYDTGFNHINLTLWVTLERAEVNDTGMLINVSFISRVIRKQLEEKPLKPKSVPDIINWAWEIFRHYPGDCAVKRIQIDLHDAFSWARQAGDTGAGSTGGTGTGDTGAGSTEGTGTGDTGAGDNDMFEITVKYSLAAAHRLVKPSLDDAENYELFGKCSHKSGHGHNYLLEITLAGQPDGTTGQIADMELVERVVNEQVIEPFDHKNLNTDTREFAKLIPTVENMAQVFFKRLEGRFGLAILKRVRVWETPETYADYYS